jgi:hypothetical protein
MTARYKNPVLKTQYWEDIPARASLDELRIGGDFKLRRAMTLGEAVSAFVGKVAPIFVIEHRTKVDSVEEFKGLYAIAVHFVLEDGNLEQKTHPIIANEQAIICKRKNPSKEQGYFLKEHDIDSGLEETLANAPADLTPAQ